MVHNKIKSAIISSAVLAIIACTNSIPTNTRLYEQNNFQELDKEYLFSSKALTQSYLKRKLEYWLDTESASPIPNEPKLLKELIYARYKHADTFCAIVSGDPGLLDSINEVQTVKDRKETDAPFRDFIDNCIFTEFQVNTYTTGSQIYPKAAMDNNGDFVITWSSGGQDGSYYGIFAQRYNSNGVTQGSEFQVNTVNTGRQIDSVIAMDNNGDFVIAWSTYDAFHSSDWDVHVQRYNAAGVAQGSEFMANTHTTNQQSQPSIAMDDTGDFVVSWSSFAQFNPNSFEIYAQRFDSAGTPQGSEFLVNTFNIFDQMESSVAMDSDGDFIISWTSGDIIGSGQDGNSLGVYAQRYDSFGTTQGSEFLVNTFTTSVQKAPSVAMDSNGDFIIAWSGFGDFGDDNYGIFAKRYDSQGEVLSEFQVNSNPTYFQFQPSVAMNGEGDFVVSWSSNQDGVNSYGIVAQRYDSAGYPAGDEFPVNTHTTGNQMVPSVAIDLDGDFVVAWTDYNRHHDGDYYGAYAKRYNSNGVAQPVP
jgi:hypothetical protein